MEVPHLESVAAEAAAEEQAHALMMQALDEVNDFVAGGKCEAVESLRDIVLMQEIGRTKPLNDDDPEFYRVLSAFYAQIFMECATKQWFMEATVREYFKKDNLINNHGELAGST